MNFYLPVSERYTILDPPNGVTHLQWDFELTEVDGLKVWRIRDDLETMLTWSVDYTFANGLGTASGGLIKLNAPTLPGDRYVLIGDLPVARPNGFKTNGEIGSAQLNADFDRLYRILQEHEKRLSGTLQTSLADPSAFEAKGKKLRNLADGADDKDAVNFGQLSSAVFNGFRAKGLYQAATVYSIHDVVYDGNGASFFSKKNLNQGSPLPVLPAIENDDWHILVNAIAGGYSFLGSTDTPNSYTGLAGQALVVNDDATGVKFADVSQQTYDIRKYGAVLGQPTLNRQAIDQAAAAIEAVGGGTLYIPEGEWEIGDGDDVVFTQDYVSIAGNGPNSHLKMTNSCLKFDAVSKATHIFGTAIRNIRLSRTGTAGPVLWLLGQNTMGVSRSTLSDVHITGTAARVNTGILAQGAWSSSFFGGSLSGLKEGFKAVIAPDNNSSANAWYLHGLEIQGNEIGLDLDGPAGIHVIATIEGNTHYGVYARNNLRFFHFDGYCEQNGSLLGAKGRDIFIHDPSYAGNVQTGYACYIKGYFSRGGNAQMEASIEIARTTKLELAGGSTFINYTQAAVILNPDGGIASRVSLQVGNLNLINTPKDIVDSNFDPYFSKHVKKVTGIKRYDQALNFGTISAGQTLVVPVIVPGIKANDEFISISTAAAGNGLFIRGWVTNDEELTLYVTNQGGAGVTTSNAIYRFIIADQDHFVY